MPGVLSYLTCDIYYFQSMYDSIAQVVFATFYVLFTLPGFLFSCFMQLLQNIVRSTELRFPSDIKDLSSDCIDLCQKLLRRNPGIPLFFLDIGKVKEQKGSQIIIKFKIPCFLGMNSFFFFPSCNCMKSYLSYGTDSSFHQKVTLNVYDACYMPIK